MVATLLAALIATAAAAAPDGARAELDAVAGRIEALKERRLAGQDVDEELTRLLVRSQELAAEIDRHAPRAAPPRTTAPAPEELRERADALRDEADRIAAAVEELDRALRDADRERRREAALETLASDSALFGEPDLGGPGPARASATTSTPGGSGTGATADRTRRTTAPEEPRGSALETGGGAERVRLLHERRAELLERIDALRADADRIDAAASRADEE